jgi:hypothetical protein
VLHLARLLGASVADPPDQAAAADLAWNVVRLWSTTAAVAMSVVAAVLPPVAALIANWGEDH